MKTNRRSLFIQLILLAFFLYQAIPAHAQLPPGKFYFPGLDSWSFRDTNNWSDDEGNYPVSHTNLASSTLGDGWSLVVDSNVPAWLDYCIYVTNDSEIETNLILNGSGSITFWYGPGWTTTNGGPGDWAQLIDLGQWTTNSSVGYFGLSIDPSGSNLWFMAQDGIGNSYSLSLPCYGRPIFFISWR